MNAAEDRVKPWLAGSNQDGVPIGGRKLGEIPQASAAGLMGERHGGDALMGFGNGNEMLFWWSGKLSLRWGVAQPWSTLYEPPVANSEKMYHGEAGVNVMFADGHVNTMRYRDTVEYDGSLKDMIWDPWREQ
jgi:prepilin-type processing-associated H-X9-DG protein